MTLLLLHSITGAMLTVESSRVVFYELERATMLHFDDGRREVVRESVAEILALLRRTGEVSSNPPPASGA